MPNPENLGVGRFSGEPGNAHLSSRMSRCGWQGLTDWIGSVRLSLDRNSSFSEHVALCISPDLQLIWFEVGGTDFRNSGSDFRNSVFLAMIPYFLKAQPDKRQTPTQIS